MTLFQFNSHFAATTQNWHEPETLDRLNYLAWCRLRDEYVDDPNIEQIVKSAFDFANNTL